LVDNLFNSEVAKNFPKVHQQ